MRAAAWVDRLNRADPAEILKDLTAELGFGEPAQIDLATRRVLGLSEDYPTVMLARGPGTTRMVAIASGDESPVREQAARIAERLSRKAPHFLWLLALTVKGRPEIAVVAWHAVEGTARIAALVVNASEVLPSDAETLSALATSMQGVVDLEIHAQWVEVLGRESISRRFFLTLQELVARLGD